MLPAFAADFAFTIGKPSAPECLGLHLGGVQTANLGDGNSVIDQQLIMREDYLGLGVSTCIESLIGGNHFR